MKLTIQKRLAAQIMKCSEKKIIFDNSRMEEIKESITKNDIRKLIKDYAIVKKKENGPSKVRARKIDAQKSKGRRKNVGSRKGKTNARTDSKRTWINKIRKQKELLKLLREKKHITPKEYRELFLKSKGGFFRSIRHLKMYLNDQKGKE